MSAVPHELTPSRQHWDGVWHATTMARQSHTALIAAVSRIIRLDGARVLEIGCGSAVDSAEFARRGAQTFATDYSLPALVHAQAYTEAATQLIAADTFHLPYRSGTFDLVFSQGLIEHFPDPTHVLHEQMRVIRPGGYLCVDVPQTWSLLTLVKRWKMRRGTWFAGWETDYSLNHLEALLRRQGLEVVDSYGSGYFPAVLFGMRNIHTLGTRYRLPLWLSPEAQQGVERIWNWLEHRRWYYRWLGCVGVIARTAETR